MVAHLVKLKLILLKNSLRRSPWQLVGVVFGALYGLGLMILVIGGLIALSAADITLARTVVVLAGSALILGWTFIPLVAAGVDMTLDPARFVTYSIPMPQLLAGLALSGIIGVPGLVTLLASVGTAGTWWRHPLSLAAALVCACIAVLTCVVLSRLVTSATTSLSSSRRFKDVSGLVALIPLVLMGPIIAAVTAGLSDASAFLPALAQTLSWTPLGAVWSVPADLALGAFGAAGVKFLIALTTLTALAWLWKLTLSRALVTAASNAVTRKSAGRLGLFARFPATPTGSVAARALTYWLRDPRYGASLIMVPLFPVILFFIGSQTGSLASLNYLGPIAAFLLVWSISADVSYDGTAFWLHVSTGVSGLADRLGRVLACAVFALPVTVIFTIVPIWITAGWSLLLPMLGLSLGILLTGFGLSSVVSARYTYNVPLPGDSPFKTPPGSGMRMAVVQFGGMAVLALLVVPELVLGVICLLTGNQLYGWLTLGAGVVLGTVLLVTGIRTGARWYDSRAPELLLAVGRNK